MGIANSGFPNNREFHGVLCMESLKDSMLFLAYMAPFVFQNRYPLLRIPFLIRDQTSLICSLLTSFNLIFQMKE